MTKHTINPIYDENSKILILGSFPSVKSREEMFFYGHPKNRFWKVLSSVFGVPEPTTITEKRHFLISHNVALWDVIASCDLTASADSSIKNVRPNDISTILSKAKIKKIFVNGKTAKKYYDQYIKETVCQDAVCLPSTSPANAAWNLEKLIEEWKIINHIE